MRFSQLRKLVEQIVASGGGGGVPDYANVLSTSPTDRAEAVDNFYLPPDGPYLVKAYFEWREWDVPEDHLDQAHYAGITVYDPDTDTTFEFGPGALFEQVVQSPVVAIIPYLPAAWGVYATVNGTELTALEFVPLS